MRTLDLERMMPRMSPLSSAGRAPSSEERARLLRMDPVTRFFYTERRLPTLRWEVRR